MNSNLTDVTQLIPQAPPFVMVDKLLRFSENELLAALTVSNSNIFVANDRFAESGLIEHMAQAVALHTGYSYFKANKTPPKGYLGAINKIEISRLPVTGEEIQTRIEILQEFNGVTLVGIEVFLNGKQIASGQMKTVIAG